MVYKYKYVDSVQHVLLPETIAPACLSAVCVASTRRVDLARCAGGVVPACCGRGVASEPLAHVQLDHAAARSSEYTCGQSSGLCLGGFDSGYVEGGSLPCVYKQLILFSNVLLYASSNIIAGLRSNLVTITPSQSPSIYPADEATILYNVKDYIEVHFSKDGAPGSASNNGAVQWAGRPWYGWATGETLTQFVFDGANAKIQPVPYRADARVKTASFYDPSVAAKAADVSPEWSEFDGVASWRYQADYYSRDIKAADANVD